MTHRCLVSVGILTALTVVLSVTTIPVAGQAPSPAAKTNGTAGRAALELATRVMACIQEHAARVQPTGSHLAADLPAFHYPRKDEQ